MSHVMLWVLVCNSACSLMPSQSDAAHTKNGKDITQNAMVSINTILIQAMRMASYDSYTTIIQLSRCKSTM